MQDEHSFLELHRIDSSIRAARVVFDDLKDASTAEAIERLRRVVLVATLGEIQRMAEELPHVDI